MRYEYFEQNRVGDHICYISDLGKARAHYPDWDVRVGLEEIVGEIAASWAGRA
jgi:CDP-paratose 2-epimerase